MGNVYVIVSACYWNMKARCWQLSRRLSEETFSSLEEAMARGESLRAKDVSVLIRPSYNEEDEDGSFFRDWWSFDGASFREARHYQPLYTFIRSTGKKRELLIRNMLSRHLWGVSLETPAFKYYQNLLTD